MKQINFFMSKFLMLLIALAIFSCESETSEDLNDNLLNSSENESPCSDDVITSYLQDYNWIGMYNLDSEALSGLSISFLDGKITVYNDDNMMVDEGDWSITDGVITFDSLSGSFERFTGEWNVVECRDSFIRIERGEDQIGFERFSSAVENEASCSDSEITSFLVECDWSGFYNLDNTALSNLRINFSEENITVYNDDNIVVDEGNWSISDGVVTFDSLSGSFERFTGEWNVIECRDNFIQINRGDEDLSFERVCN